MRHVRTLATLAVVLGACSDDSLALRSGAIEVYRGQSYNVTGLDPRVAVYYRYQVADVARENNRIVVALRWGTNDIATVTPPPINCRDCTSTTGSSGASIGHLLLVSDDLGKTWRRAPIGWEASQGNFLHGVGLHGDKITMVGQGQLDGVEGVQAYWTLKDADLATNALLPNGQLDGKTIHAFPQAYGPRLTGVSLPYATLNTRFEVLEHVDYEIASGALMAYSIDTPTSLEFFGARDGYGWTQSSEFKSSDGKTFMLFGQQESPYTTALRPPPLSRHGVIATTPFSGVMPDYAAVTPLAYWPVMFHPGRSFLASRGLVAVAANREHTHSLAGELTGSDQQPEIFDLGEGEYNDFAMVAHVHPRFAQLIAIGNPSPTRLVDLPPGGGADDIGLPLSPFADGDTEFGRLEWALPLDGEEYLLFWIGTVKAGDGSVSDILYAGRETGKRTSIDQSGFTPTRFNRFPNAVEFGPVERACFTVASCGVDAKSTCLLRALPLPLSGTAMQGLLAAADDGCATIGSAYANLGNGTCTASTCAGTSLTCAPATFNTFSLCSPGTCSTSDVAHCEGEVAKTCYQGYWLTQDCAAWGKRCDVVNGVPGCFSISFEEGCSVDALPYPPQCIGTVGTRCSILETPNNAQRQDLRVVDCAALGFTGCAVSGADPICVP